MTDAALPQAGVSMVQLARNWWVLALRGLLMVILGLIALFQPQETTTTILLVLVIIFGAFALVEGIFLLATAFAQTRSQRGRALVQGFIGVIVGILFLVWPLASAAGLIYLLMVWMILAGAGQIYSALELPSGTAGRGQIALGGVLLLILALLVLLHPLAMLSAATWLFGILALLAGIATLAVGFRLRGLEA